MMQPLRNRMSRPRRQRRSKMKVFEFDPATGRRGAQIADIPRPTALSNINMARCVLPKHAKDVSWSIATRMYRDGQPMTEFYDRPVCFCLGQFTAGTDTTWQWYALIPEDNGISDAFIAQQEELYAEGFSAH